MFLFCEDEEIGGQGARKFTRSGLTPTVIYIVEMDRRGHNDAVFYGCDNREFAEYVEKFGFEEAFGSFSDISVVAPHLGIAAVNISAGYYNEHQLHEHINLSHMEHNITRILEMVQTHTGQFEYVERKAHGYRSFGGQTFLWDQFSGSTDMRDGRKTLMPVPETAYVEVNGKQVENGLAHFMDDKGVVYDYLSALDVAVRADYTKAYGRDGRPLKFSRRAAQKIQVLPLETALKQLNVG